MALIIIFYYYVPANNHAIKINDILTVIATERTTLSSYVWKMWCVCICMCVHVRIIGMHCM